MFSYDATDVKNSTFKLLPARQWFTFEIKEAHEGLSKNGNPLVKCVCRVVNNTEFDGVQVWHYVNFLPPESKGAGLALHFLKCLGEPSENELTVDCLRWIGKRILGFVQIEEYQGKQKNKIAQVKALAETEEIPF